MKRDRSPSSIVELDFTPHGPVHPSPADWRDHIVYFLIVDRFDDGKRNPPYDGSGGDMKRDPRLGNGVHGGTLRGVTRHLRYLKNLGITTLWLSPVLKNRLDPGGSLHGYAIQNFLAIDPHFGTTSDLKTLVSSAHALGMYVILDIVINHTGDNWAYENDSHPTYRPDGKTHPFGFWRAEHPEGAFTHDDAVWPAELQSPECYSRRGGVVNWHDAEQAVHADFYNLKDLDLSNHVVLETLIAIYKYWIVETDIDGYRIDTVKHVAAGEAVKFFNAIKEFAESIGKKNFLLFGEIVDNDATISKYVGRQKNSEERLQALDASLDFPLYFVLEEVIKGFVSPRALRDRYAWAKESYTYTDVSDCFVTFLDNHDQMVRPYRRFLYNVPDRRQVLLGVAYLFTAPGIPALYYGTEQGFNGGGDNGPYQDNQIRECMFGGRWGAFGTSGMHFFDQKHPLYREVARFAAVRQSEPALRYGRFYFREISEDGTNFSYPEKEYGMLAYSRILDTEELLIVLNLRRAEYRNHIVVDKILSPPGTAFVDLLNRRRKLLVDERSGRATVTITLPPYGVAILKRSSIGGTVSV